MRAQQLHRRVMFKTNRFEWLAKKKKYKKPTQELQQVLTLPQKTEVLGLAITFCLNPQLLSQASIGQKSYQFSAYNLKKIVC